MPNAHQYQINADQNCVIDPNTNKKDTCILSLYMYREFGETQQTNHVMSHVPGKCESYSISCDHLGLQ